MPDVNFPGYSALAQGNTTSLADDALIDINETDPAFHFNGSGLAVPAGFDFTGEISAGTPLFSGLNIEAWIKPTSIGSFERIIDFGNGAANNNIVFGREGTSTNLMYEVFRGGSGRRLVAPNALRQNVWQYVVVTQTPTSPGSSTNTSLATIYIDGLRVAEGLMDEPMRVRRYSNFIGRSNWDGNAQYMGGMDEVAVYSRALLPARIRAHFVASGRSFSPVDDASQYLQATGCRSAINEEARRCLAYWRLDENFDATSSGPRVALDLSEDTQNNILVQGGVTRQTATALRGDGNTAVTLNGSTGHLIAPRGFDFGVAGPGSAFGGLTVEAWIRPTAQQSWARVIDFGNGSSADNIVLSRHTNTNLLSAEIYRGGSGQQVLSQAAVLRLNTWQHVAVTVGDVPDGNGKVPVVLYYNGQIAGTGSVLPPLTVTRNKNSIGRNNWGGNPLFQGDLDEMTIYRTALTPEQIASYFYAATDIITGPMGASFGFELGLIPNQRAFYTFQWPPPSGEVNKKISLAFAANSLSGLTRQC